MLEKDHLGEVTKTQRGFEVVHFEDRYGSACTLQQSSAIGEHIQDIDNPGSSFVWLGWRDSRMHLDRQQVSALVTYLNRWLATGKFSEGKDGE